MTNAWLHAQYDDVWERRDVLGVHPQKQAGFVWVGACVPAGRLFASDLREFARVAEECAPEAAWSNLSRLMQAVHGPPPSAVIEGDGTHACSGINRGAVL